LRKLEIEKQMEQQKLERDARMEEARQENLRIQAEK
jgi:hypothetical protein